MEKVQQKLAKYVLKDHDTILDEHDFLPPPSKENSCDSIIEEEFSEEMEEEALLPRCRVPARVEALIDDLLRKRRGMSWTESGVLAMALHAAQTKRNATQTAQINTGNHTSP